MIPKIIHYCWLSDDPLPDTIRQYIENWKMILPDYEIRKWDFNRFPRGKSVWVNEAFDNRKYAFASDYIRNYALYHDGGIYLDSDVEVLKSFDALLHLPYFMCMENGSGFIEAAVMGSEPGNPIYRKMLNYYEGRHFVKADGTLDMLPLPQVMAVALKDYVIKKIPDVESFDPSPEVISVLPYYYFSPINIESKRLQMNDSTVCIHRFAATWAPWHKKLKRRIKLIVGPDATEWFIRTKRKLLRRD